MALSAARFPKVLAADSYAQDIANSVTMYQNAFVALVGPDAASLNGYLRGYTGADGEIPLGGLASFSLGGDTEVGDTSETPTIPEAYTGLGAYVIRQNVTGASAITDRGKVVYISDDTVLTLTRPTKGIPFGMVLDWRSSTECDVLIFPLWTLISIMLGGCGQTVLHLGHYECAAIADGDIRTAFPAPFHGKILSTFAHITTAPTGSGGTTALNVEIGGTNITGGVVTVATGDAVAAKKAGTAVTADGAEEFHEGDSIDIEASSTVSMTAGAFDLYAEIALTLGA